MQIWKDFRFESAHWLPNVPESHKCFRMHGHSYRVVVHVRGEGGEASGWVMDFGELSEAFRPLKERLDHRVLNEIEGLENPTAENLARWIWRRLEPALPGLWRVEVHETPRSGCAYVGD